MTGALLGTLSVFASNVLLAMAFVGLGLGVRRSFGLAAARLEDVFLAFWLGFGLVILFLLLWNFALPVGPLALAVVLSAGWFGALRARPELVGAFREFRAPRWAAVAGILFCLWVANLGSGRMTGWDTSLYHMQGVKWARSYPVVPGLANVFGPLGFNNASLLYNAMLDTGPWAGRAWHVSNGVLVSAFGAQAIHSLGVLSRCKFREDPARVFSAFLVPVAVHSALGGLVSNFSTALPTALLLLVVAQRLYAGAWKQHTSDERAFDAFAAAALVAVAVSIKMSSAVFAATVFAMSCVAIVRLDAGARLRRRALAWTVIGVAAIGSAWAARGLVLSGYAMFPNQTLSMPVDWRAPSEHARAEFDFVVHSARATSTNVAYVSGEVSGLNAWGKPWIRSALQDPFNIAIPLALGVAAILLLFAVGKRSNEPGPGMRGGLVLLPVGFALAAWVAAAPMPHYGAPFAWALAAFWGAQLSQRTEARRPFFVLWAVLGVTPCFVGPWWTFQQFNLASMRAKEPVEYVRALWEYNARVPDPGHWLQSDRPTPQVKRYVTESGLELNVPTGARLARCWDAPLPCTPNPAPNLKLRVPGRIDRGFRVEGDWQMENWPETWRPELLDALREGWSRRD